MNSEKLIEFRNKNNVFANLIGIKLVEIEETSAKAIMAVSDAMINPQNAVHGGCLYTIADVAGGGAASVHGYQIATLDSNFHYLKAGLNTKMLIAVAREIKAGKRVMVYDISVEDEKGEVLARGIFTYMQLSKKIELN